MNQLLKQQEEHRKAHQEKYVANSANSFVANQRFGSGVNEFQSFAYRAGFDAFMMSPLFEEMKKVIEFYADRTNWTTRSGKIGVTEIWNEDYDGIPGEPYEPSGGKLARTLLQELK